MPKQGSPEVVATGELFADVVFGGLPSLPALGEELNALELTTAPGGGPAICAVALRRLGVPVACCAKIGGDAFGQMVVAALRTEGVLTETVSVSGTESTNLTVAFPVGDERAFVTHRGIRAAHTDEEVRSALAMWAPSVLFVGGLVASEDLLREARARGITIVLDIGWEIAVHRAAALRRVLPLVDVFLPNEAEILAVTGADTVEAAAAALLDDVATVVVKRGRRGALGVMLGRLLCAPTFRVHTVDTTGAGHAFDGGYIYGLLRGWETEQCLRAGNACGALSTTRYGGIAGLPGEREFLDLLECQELVVA